jgi:hypothetical protein
MLHHNCAVSFPTFAMGLHTYTLSIAIFIMLLHTFLSSYFTLVFMLIDRKYRYRTHITVSYTVSMIRKCTSKLKNVQVKGALLKI